MVSKVAFILWLFPSLLAPAQVHALGMTQRASLPVLASAAPPATLSLYPRRNGSALAASTRKPRRSSGVAARTTERKLLLLAPQHRLLRRFVDRTTGLVKR